jgi:alkyl sulfatase BDS1-like metallo-beta-lactamase superfamily hydrolase
MKHWKWFKGLLALVAILFISFPQMNAIALTAHKSATEITKEANKKVLNNLPFDNTEDFELATKGFIDKLPDPVLIPAVDKPGGAWNLQQYQFLLENGGVSATIPTTDLTQLPKAPDTVNPSLWRNAQLNMQHGLYEVVPGIYQIRGYDISEMTLVEGKKGWILIDPLTSNEPAKAALDLVNANIRKGKLNFKWDHHFGRTEPLPISAIIYTHSHADHYAGAGGIIDSALVYSETNRDGIKIYAPEGFLKEAVSENVFAGNVMSRRASYMYGNLIPKDAKGQVDGGLGKTTSAGQVSLIAPTDIITFDTKETEIDGVKITFQNVPGSEAPAEMLFYFPDFQALCASEDATHTMHNLYTLRGAKVRDAIGWAKYLNETIELFGKDVDVVFASHHWPIWDKEETPEKNEVVEYLKKQRDLYKYIHDQTLRFANKGQTMLEIAEELQLPPSLSQEWYNRGYYGSLNHNVKAVYQRYLGWFDGNPAHLYSLPPEKAGAKYIKYIGGARAAIEEAKKDFANGTKDDYRWVAQVMSDVVFGTCKKNNLPPYRLRISADETTQNCIDATQLEADALEQLGYQAESGPWRNFFLTGAQELRDGVNADLPSPDSGSSDTIAAMTPDLLFDYLAIRLKGFEAEENHFQYIFRIILPSESYLLSVENGVLNYTKDGDEPIAEAETTITLTRDDLQALINGEVDLQALINGEIALDPSKITGDVEKFKEFVGYGDFPGYLDKKSEIPFWFNIVLP